MDIKLFSKQYHLYSDEYLYIVWTKTITKHIYSLWGRIPYVLSGYKLAVFAPVLHSLPKYNRRWYVDGHVYSIRITATYVLWRWLLTKHRHDDVIKWKPFPRYWPFVQGIHRSPVNIPHNGQWRRAMMFSLICARINGWVNNGEAGDLRRHLAHYDVIVMRQHLLCHVQLGGLNHNILPGGCTIYIHRRL